MNKLVSNIGKFLVLLDADTLQAKRNYINKVYIDSQNDCPIRTGRLKGSGYIKESDNLMQLGYTAPYAAIVDYKTGFFRDNVILNEGYYPEEMARLINKSIIGL